MSSELNRLRWGITIFLNLNAGVSSRSTWQHLVSTTRQCIRAVDALRREYGDHFIFRVPSSEIRDDIVGDAGIYRAANAKSQYPDGTRITIDFAAVCLRRYGVFREAHQNAIKTIQPRGTDY